MKIETLVENFGSALDFEIDAARRRSGARYFLYNGRFLGAVSDGFLYEYNAGVEVTFPAECPGELELQGRRYRCTVVGAADGFVVIVVGQQIEEELSRATLRSAAWRLLQELKNRTLEIISTTLNRNRELVMKVVGYEEPRPPNAVSSVQMVIDRLPSYFNDLQRAAIAVTMTREVCFLWGPPATTKTTAIGGIVRATIDLGQTALVASHSNVAVDAATLSVARALGGTACLSQGECLRIGTPRLPEVRSLAAVNPREVIRRRHPEFLRELERLEQRETRIRARLRQQTTPTEQTRLNRQLRALREPMKSLTSEYAKFEAELINNAKVIVTTLSRMALSPQICGRRFDAVLIDEASMAVPPAVAVAVSLAEKRVVVAGDFRQLSPVVLAKDPLADRWLRRDLFEIAGIVKNVESGQPDSRLHAFYVQHRMHPVIRQVISDTFYNGMLQDGEIVLAETSPLAALAPSPGRPIVVCDIGALRSRCLKELQTRGSHYNIGSALASMEMARQCIESGGQQIAILSPYNCQARVISMLARESQMNQRVRAGTIHQYQGGERDVVILDLVDTIPLSQPGLPLRGAMGTAAARLLNVGISRARGKLVLVCDLAFIRSTSPANSVLSSILRRIDDSATIDFSPILLESQSSGGTRGVNWFSEQAMLVRLAADVESATRQITVNTSMPRILDIFDDRRRVLLANRRVSLGVAAMPTIASPDLQDDAAAFEDPVTAEQLVLLDSTLWYAGAALPDAHPNLFARINLPEAAVVISHMCNLTSIQALLAPEADLLQQALNPQAQPQPREIVFGRRRLGI